MQDIAEILKTCFDNVQPDVCLVENNGKQSPKYWDGNEWVYAGFDESKCEVVYLREVENDPITRDVGGCDPQQGERKTIRIVIYIRELPCNLNPEYYRRKVYRLLNNCNKITVVKTHTKANKLLKLEHSEGRCKIMPNSLYMAFDYQQEAWYDGCCDDDLDELFCKPEEKPCCK